MEEIGTGHGLSSFEKPRATFRLRVIIDQV